MSFAYGGQLVQNEVAATVATPPAVIVSMRRALRVAFAVIAAFYFAIAVGEAGLGKRRAGRSILLRSWSMSLPVVHPLPCAAALRHSGGSSFSATSCPAAPCQRTRCARLLPRSRLRHAWQRRYGQRAAVAAVRCAGHHRQRGGAGPRRGRLPGQRYAAVPPYGGACGYGEQGCLGAAGLDEPTLKRPSELASVPPWPCMGVSRRAAGKHLCGCSPLEKAPAGTRAANPPFAGFVPVQRKWLPARLARHPWLLRLTIRSLYVCLITFLAALIPFFTQLA